MGMNNTFWEFPMSLGYCEIGHVEKIGLSVKKVTVGDRVLVYHGHHSLYHIRPQDDITKVDDDNIKSIEFVRPKCESYPHHWTHQDDCNAILNMIASNKIQVEPIISRIQQPVNAPQIYNELCDNKKFPIGTVFDWRKI